MCQNPNMLTETPVLRGQIIVINRLSVKSRHNFNGIVMFYEPHNNPLPGYIY